MLLRAAPNNGRVLGTVSRGQHVFVRGAIVHDRAGRTWAPVMTRTGQAGWVAGWLLAYRGSPQTNVRMVLRATPSLAGPRRSLVKDGARVWVLGTKGGHRRTRLAQGADPRGHIGWIAAWLTRP